MDQVAISRIAEPRTRHCLSTKSRDRKPDRILRRTSCQCRQKAVLRTSKPRFRQRGNGLHRRQEGAFRLPSRKHAAVLCKKFRHFFGSTACMLRTTALPIGPGKSARRRNITRHSRRNRNLINFNDLEPNLPAWPRLGVTRLTRAAYCRKLRSQPVLLSFGESTLLWIDSARHCIH
jgi:hypothetical protein